MKFFTYVVDCAALAAPDNGSLSTTALTTGTIVTVTCNPGYTLKGDASLLCQDNGMWDKGVGICIPGGFILCLPNQGRPLIN